VPAIILVFAYIAFADVLPLGALIVSSLMKYSAPTITPDILTLENYSDLLHLKNIGDAFRNTIVLAVLTSVICLGIGLFVSYMDVRRPSASTKTLAFLGIIPVAVPGVVYGIGLLGTLVRTPFYGTIWILLIAYIAKHLPYSIVVSRSGFLQIHPELEQSARISGASGLKALRHITLPLLRPTLISITFFVLLMSIKELSASVLLYTSRSEVLSVLTWHYMDSGNYQFAAAIGVLLTVIMLGLALLLRWVFRIRLESTMSRSGV
jgi:iron(III) transport system permease protein